MTWQRARSPEKILKRRQAILGTAARLLRKNAYADISLDEIGKGAGLSTSGLYRYFQSKESLFYELYLQALTGWVGETWTQLEPYAGRNDGAAISATLAMSLMKHPDLVQLSPLVPGILSGALKGDERQELLFKEAQIKEQMIAALRRTMPSLSVKQVERLLGVFLALVAALEPAGEKMCGETLFAGRPPGWLELFGESLRAYMRGQMLEIVDRRTD